MIDEARLYQMLGEQLRTLRERHSDAAGRMTQATLAKLVGLERTSITNIEKGTQKVPLHVLYRICEALGVTALEVLPPLTEVQAAKPEPVDEDVSFITNQAEMVKAPPLTKRAIEAVLNPRAH